MSRRSLSYPASASLIPLESTSVTTFFGDGSDGAFDSTGNTSLSTSVDGGVVVKQYTSFLLNSGHSYSTSNPCECLLVFVQNDCTIEGEVNQNGLGAQLATASGFAYMASASDAKMYGIALAEVGSLVVRTPTGGNGGNGGQGGGGSGNDKGGAGGNGTAATA